MIDSNNINVMREKLRKVSGGGSGVIEEIERIDNLIGSSPIPGTQRTITGSLNYLYDNIGGETLELLGQWDGNRLGSITKENISEYRKFIVMSSSGTSDGFVSTTYYKEGFLNGKSYGYGDTDNKIILTITDNTLSFGASYGVYKIYGIK